MGAIHVANVLLVFVVGRFMWGGVVQVRVVPGARLKGREVQYNFRGYFFGGEYT